MMRERLLERVKAALCETFGPRLKGVVLYGSEARGESAPDSDIDFLVLLEGPLEEPNDSWACINAVYPLVLESGRPIHAEPVDAAEYEAGEFPLYQNAKREGVSL
jgi:predicted nucleotidyltransferase